MKKWIARIGVFVSTVILAIFFGCAIVQDAVSPAQVEKEAEIYADMNDANDRGWFEQLLPWDSVQFAEKVEAKMTFMHDKKQVELKRDIEDDIMLFGFLHGIHLTNLNEARDFQQKIFNPSGPIGLGITTLFGGTLGALLIPRPGEKKKIVDAKEEGKKEGIKEANNVAVSKATNNKA